MKKIFYYKNTIILLAGIALNVAGSLLCGLLNLPVYLDSVGTILVASLFGPFPGMVIGYLTNVILIFKGTTNFYYAICSVLIAIFAGFYAERGYYRKWYTALLTAVPIGFFAGIPSAFISWGFGNGTSSFLELLSAKTAQVESVTAIHTLFFNEIGWDILDKAISVMLVFLILHLMSNKMLEKFPLGRIYTTGEGIIRGPHGLPTKEKIKETKKEIRHSLRARIILLFAAMAVILSTAAIMVNFFLYSDTLKQQEIMHAENAASFTLDNINGDDIDTYLAEGENTAKYKSMKQLLEEVRSNVPQIEYLYIYQIKEDGCHVVFDLDTDEIKGDPVGAVIPFDSALSDKMISDLLAGKEIDAFTVNDQYGNLLTVYKPVLRSDGTTAAYIGIDISMNMVYLLFSAFIVRTVALLAAISLLIMYFAMWYTDSHVVRPVNKMAGAMGEFAYDDSMKRYVSAMNLKQLDIRTGDEIENLYDSIVKSSDDMTHYIDELDDEEREIRDKAATISRMQDNTILSFAELVESRDSNTGQHIRRTAAYVGIIARQMLKDQDYPDILDTDFISKIVKSAPLHDIGKIKIPDAILNKPGRLTDEEFAVMKTHTSEGAKILSLTMKGLDQDNYLSYAIRMAYYHHEKWNGRGYPEGIAGEKIPLEARIMAIADVFDALIAKRSYKEPFTHEKAYAIIVEESPGQFDPKVLEAFKEVFPELCRVVGESRN